MRAAASKKAGIFDAGEKLFVCRFGAPSRNVYRGRCVFIGCELLTVFYPGTEGATELLGIMTSGATAPFFWFEIIGGLLIPFLLLASAKRRKNTMLVVLASALVMFGVFCKRVWLPFSRALR